jgi:glycerophosphoryl diester phosphodiesterase
MLVLSHRGYHVHALENTLPAFEAAIAMGVDGIETDIRLSADQVPILFHDHLAPDGRDVAALSHAELASAVGHPIPTLEQALQLPLSGQAEILWNLEVKTPAAVDQTIALVNRYRGSRQILITSFWHPVVAEISRRMIDVDCGLLVAHRPINMRAWPDWVPQHPRLKTVVWYWETIDAELIAGSAACGLRCTPFFARISSVIDTAASMYMPASTTLMWNLSANQPPPIAPTMAPTFSTSTKVNAEPRL